MSDRLTFSPNYVMDAWDIPEQIESKQQKRTTMFGQQEKIRELKEEIQDLKLDIRKLKKSREFEIEEEIKSRTDNLRNNNDILRNEIDVLNANTQHLQEPINSETLLNKLVEILDKNKATIPTEEDN